mgnify:CR=1 FL=1
MADWQAIKTEYITTETSYRKLAQKYGLSYNAIGNRSRDEKWQELRDQHLTKTMTKTVNAIGSKQAERTAKLIGVSDLLLDKVKSLIEDNPEILILPQNIKHISGVLKDLKDIQMIKSDADMREQEARIEKLRKEAMVERESNEVKVTIVGELEEYSG